MTQKQRRKMSKSLLQQKKKNNTTNYVHTVIHLRNANALNSEKL